MIIRVKRKLYTQYDDTDRLKQMKDSDILAEKKKKGPGYGQVAGAAGAGVVAGGVVGGLTGGAAGLFRKGGSMVRGASKYGKAGMLIGGTIAAGVALHKRNKEAKGTQFYNDRLEYAQRQARRREKKDWKTNMTQREGYTY